MTTGKEIRRGLHSILNFTKKGVTFEKLSKENQDKSPIAKSCGYGCGKWAMSSNKG